MATPPPADKAYMDEQGVEKGLAEALAAIIKEKPPKALRRIAQLISPETFIDTTGSDADVKSAVGGLPEQVQEKLRTALAALSADSGITQSAFVFVKPHANTAAVNELLKSKFAELGITITADGEIDGAAIDANKYIDKHYYAIASKATIMEPKELNVPKEKFKEFFGEDWDTVLAEQRAFNAAQIKVACGWNAEELDSRWDATADNKRVKFGGGFYCGQIEHEGKKLYTFNAFFMTLRSKFTAEGTSIHYYVVEWTPSKLKWADFRAKVLGPTDPSVAPPDSLRGTLFADWEKLGLRSVPNTGDNGIHASASPFEGFAERTNWLKTAVGDDAFAKQLLEVGLSEETLKAWSIDPQVTLTGGDPKKGSLFDQLEDLDLAECIAKCKEIAEAQ